MFERFGLRGGAALALVAAGAAVTLAACQPVASQNPVAAGSSVAGGGAPSAGTAGTAASAQGAVASTGECTLADLTISLGAARPSGAPGVSQRPIIFKNTGAAACFVVGFPGVAALDGGGAQTFQAARVNAEGPQVTLQPGDSASALLGTIAYRTAPGATGTPCPSVPNLLVTPPDETHSRQIAFGATVCQAPTITTLASGVNGGDSTQAATRYSEARQLWTSGVSAIAAEQGSYWTQAAGLLTNAVESGAAGTTGFSAAAQELTQLAALPDAMLTQSQKTQESTLVSELNGFFHTPGLYN
jgi:uncharacterized protein DUF4232